MGLDFVDLMLRIEQRFGVHPDFSHWDEVAAGRPRFDLTAGEVCDVVERCLAPHRARLAAEATDAAAAGPVPVLPYQPRDAPRVAPSDFEGDVWLAVREEIARALSVPATKIERHSWLVRDLGMSA